MNVTRRRFQITMAEHHLDGAQVGAGLEQMRCPAMAQSMRSDMFSNACSSRGIDTGVPNRFVGGRPVWSFARTMTWEQVLFGFSPSPIRTQRLQQLRIQRQVAVLASLALRHTNDHALAVDVAHFKVDQFRPAHASGI